MVSKDYIMPLFSFGRLAHPACNLAAADEQVGEEDLIYAYP